MPLFKLNPIGFIPSANIETAKTFYEKTLGLTFISNDGFALVFRTGPVGDVMLRVVHIPDHKPAPFTIFGWEATNIESTVDHMRAGGVKFEIFEGFGQDERGIWTAPGGGKVAWFKDPDGNTLSVSQHTSLLH